VGEANVLSLIYGGIVPGKAETGCVANNAYAATRYSRRQKRRKNVTNNRVWRNGKVVQSDRWRGKDIILPLYLQIMNQIQTPQGRDRRWSMGTYVALGAAIGVVLGAVLRNVGVGIAIGAALGAAFGARRAKQ
jgi:hypothetical protein